MPAINPEDVNAHLEQLLASEGLLKSATNRRLLTYLVQRSLQNGEGPKEAEIAIDVFGRNASFSGGEDSVVRVSMRGLRQKLLEYYAGPGKNSPLIFDFPKGAYRLAIAAREPVSAPLQNPPGTTAPDPSHKAVPTSTGARLEPAHRSSRWLSGALLGLLVASAALNAYWWLGRPTADAAIHPLRESALWREVAHSDRPVMFVLGDLFMYTQTDPTTGRLQTVRDPQINSSDDLRAFLASNPALSADRGLRYSSMIQKSAAAGLAAIIPIIHRPGRPIEVRLRDELLADDLRTYDIIYMGPITRIGPLARSVHGGSRFEFDAATSAITNRQTGKTWLPEGELSGNYKDYALVTRFPGPAGNSITVITSGNRNAGLLQIIRTLTTPLGVSDFVASLGEVSSDPSPAFEALMSVSGFKQTELATEVVEVHALKDPKSGI